MSAQPCGCDLEAKWTCEQHRKPPEGLDRLCQCGHNIYAHDDYEGETHECQKCACEQFVDIEIEIGGE